MLCYVEISLVSIKQTEHYMHDRLGIRILSALEDKIRIPARPCNILYLTYELIIARLHR